MEDDPPTRLRDRASATYSRTGIRWPSSLWDAARTWRRVRLYPGRPVDRNSAADWRGREATCSSRSLTGSADRSRPALVCVLIETPDAGRTHDAGSGLVVRSALLGPAVRAWEKDGQGGVSASRPCSRSSYTPAAAVGSARSVADMLVSPRRSTGSPRTGSPCSGNSRPDGGRIAVLRRPVVAGPGRGPGGRGGARRVRTRSSARRSPVSTPVRVRSLDPFVKLHVGLASPAPGHDETTGRRSPRRADARRRFIVGRTLADVYREQGMERGRNRGWNEAASRGSGFWVLEVGPPPIREPDSAARWTLFGRLPTKSDSFAHVGLATASSWAELLAIP